MFKFAIGLLLINLLCFSKINGQNKPVILKYNIPSKQLVELKIQKLGLRVVFSNDPDFSFSLKNKRNDIVKLNLITDGLYKIADGFDGHIIYLESGDTISITLKEIANLKKILDGGTFLKYFDNLTVRGKYAWHYIFFDVFNRRTENLYPLKNFEVVKNVMLFKSKCDKALLIGETLLDSLYKKDKISLNFKLVAQQELNAMYVARMCTPLSLVSKKNINPEYFEKLNTFTFNDSSFAVLCNDYIQAGALYTYYIHNDLNVKNPNSNLSNEIKSILLNYSGIIKDKLLSWQLEDYIDKDYPLFDSCYKVFLKECKNSTLRNSVIKKVQAYKRPLKVLANINVKDLLISTKIQNQFNNTKTLQSLCQDSIPTLIDCWASWCIPCRDQMQFMHEFEKKYAGKLNVVYLSFDKDEIKWKSFVKKNNLKNNQFIIDNDFGSDFSKYFDLKTIPRYILISKGGILVLNTSMPLPALQEEFEEELKKYLN